MRDETNWLIVGKLVAPQGLLGEIRVNPSSDFPERFIRPGKRWLQKKNEEPKEVLLKSGRQVPGKSIYIISFEIINNRTSAELLIGQSLLVPSTHRPNLNEDEYHYLDLVGLKVKLSKEGEAIGEITDLTSAGNDLLEVKLVEGKKVLIPFVKEIVPEIFLKDGWLKISPPPGLLEL